MSSSCLLTIRARSRETSSAQRQRKALNSLALTKLSRPLASQPVQQKLLRLPLRFQKLELARPLASRNGRIRGRGGAFCHPQPSSRHPPAPPAPAPASAPVAKRQRIEGEATPRRPPAPAPKPVPAIVPAAAASPPVRVASAAPAPTAPTASGPPKPRAKANAPGKSPGKSPGKAKAAKAKGKASQPKGSLLEQVMSVSRAYRAEAAGTEADME